VKPILNLDDVPLEHHAHGEKFAARYGHVGPAIGAKLLGCGLHVVPPGKRAWPFHNHHVNEELYVILDGEGSLRMGDREYAIRAGDVITAPPGGRDTAHQLVNTSAERDLRYLCVSTMIPSEVVEYPDSNKTAFYVGSAPGGDPSVRTIAYRGRLEPALDYWDGE
jgi:uncharacterized cupin superfamily protein